jgi:hypothetical protein
MKLPLSTTCLLIGLIGAVIGVLISLKLLHEKAKTSNLIFNYQSALLEDWYVPVINLLIVLSLWLVLPYRTGKVAEYSDLTTIGFFGIAGITGNVFLSIAISSVRKRFIAATDFKTDKADEAAGVLGTPTPADKPEPVKP